MTNCENDNLGSSNDNVCPKFKLNRIPVDFMESELSRLAISGIIQQQIESTRETQTNIDGIYDKLCTTIWQEMNDKIPKYDTSRGTRRRYKNYKPYWTDELTQLWSVMRSKEREFLKCITNNRSRRNTLRQMFKEAQRNFDKLLR